jgi:hypothetical protein
MITRRLQRWFYYYEDFHGLEHVKVFVIMKAG